MTAWLAEGEAEGQTTFLRQLLLTLPRLPFSAHMLAGAPLVGAVQRLARHRQAPFAVCVCMKRERGVDSRGQLCGQHLTSSCGCWILAGGLTGKACVISAAVAAEFRGDLEPGLCPLPA